MKHFVLPLIVISTEPNSLKRTYLTRINRGGSRAAVTSKMERFVTIVNGWKPLTIITKRSILDVAASLDPPLVKILDLVKIYPSRVFNKEYDKTILY